jgi:hypothetical protein
MRDPLVRLLLIVMLVVLVLLLGRCDVDWHADRGIVAVACLGSDIIKVWPLPVEQPWWEEPLDPHRGGGKEE